MSHWADEAPSELGVPGTLLFENNRVRIWELIMKPGDICQWHTHPYDHLLVIFKGAHIEGMNAKGEPVDLDIGDNCTFYIPRSEIPEIARNVSADRELRELIVDFKDPSAATEPLSSFLFFSAGTATTATPQGQSQ
jgi:hypothetical protein